MKRVEFEHINAEVTGYGFGKGLKNEFFGAEEVIQKRVRDGWNYQGYLPLTTRGTGEIEMMSLVFVKED